MTSAQLLHLLLDDPVEELYDDAPCGYLFTDLDGLIVGVNATLAMWLGCDRDELVGRQRFPDLLTVGGKLFYETHYAPLLQMQGEVRSIALELRLHDGERFPVLVTSAIRSRSDGAPRFIRTMIVDARERRTYERELLRARKEAETERARLLQLTAALQAGLLPSVLPTVPGLEAAAHYHRAADDEVAGDFYDLFPLADGTWGVFLGDVSGTGPEAAAVTSLVRYTLRDAAVYDQEPASVLAHLDAVLQQQPDDHPRWCTLLFGRLMPDGDGFTVTLAAGGHPPAVLLHADGSATVVDTVGGQPAGALHGARFRSATVRLGPGDGLLLHTDGLTGARTAGGGLVEDDLAAVTTALKRLPAQGIVDAVATLLEELGAGVTDDVAILALTVPGA